MVTMVMALLLQGCVGKLFVKKGQYLLTQQKVTGNKRLDSEKLETLFRQKTNNQILGFMPQLYCYLVGERFLNRDKLKRELDSLSVRYQRQLNALDQASDEYQKLEIEREKKLDDLNRKIKQGNWFMRNFGEPPSIYDSSLTSETLREIKAYYFNQGFFYTEVSAKIDTTKRLQNIIVKYKIDEAGVQRIDSVRYVADDPVVQHFLDSTKGDALVKKGQRFNRDNQVAERERIERLLRNNGYLTFSRSLITINNDTAFAWRYKVSTTIIVRNPPRGKLMAYLRGETNFYIAESGEAATFPDSLERPDVTYRYSRRNFKESILKSKMPFLKDKYYNQDHIVRSQVALSTMDLYRFVNFNYDTINGKANIKINAIKLPRFEISNELGAVLSFGAPGPYVNLGFKVRNAFGTMSIFEVNGRYSEEGQLSVFLPDSIYRSRELGVTSSLTFPSILIPFGLGTLFPSLTPRTRFSVSLVDNFRPEYSRTQLRFNVTYSVQPNSRVTYGVSPADISFNWIPPDRINAKFFEFLLQQALERGDARILNFRNYVTTAFTGFYAYNTIIQNNNRRGDYARLGLEFGGAAPTALGYILGQQPAFADRNSNNQLWGLQVFRYYRLNADLRRYFEINKKAVFATHLNMGIVSPWATENASNASLPWEKYFFVGGPTSMRGWFSRRLGPGSYYPTVDENGGATYFSDQPGELMIELNGEWRQKIAGFLEGAAFVDMGNIWSVRDDAARPGAGFRSDKFWREIAIAGGLGIRLNFDILIFRFDMGAKLYVPNDQFGSRWQIQNLKLPNPFSTADPMYNYSFGVGYPF